MGKVKIMNMQNMKIMKTPLMESLVLKAFQSVG